MWKERSPHSGGGGSGFFHMATLLIILLPQNLKLLQQDFDNVRIAWTKTTQNEKEIKRFGAKIILCHYLFGQSVPNNSTEKTRNFYDESAYPQICSQAKKICGCQMVTHPSIAQANSCLTSLTLTALFCPLMLVLCITGTFNWGILLSLCSEQFTAHPSLHNTSMIQKWRQWERMVRSMELSSY